MIGESDWLAQRLLDQRVVALSGELDDEAANRASPNSACSTPPVTTRWTCGSPASPRTSASR